jgi:hypothetical protein
MALAGYSIILDGQDLGEPERDLSGAIGPRLISLSIAEKRGGEADQLDVVIHDHDGTMALPAEGARLRVSLGWTAGADVPLGLVDKGSFTVDEVEYSGPPDIITIRARSADFASAYRVRRERSHRQTTLGAVIRRIASENGLEARISADLAGIQIPVLAQDQKSDMALVHELGRQHDAIATVKAKRLIFSRIGSGTTATGRAIPAGTITRGENDRFSYRRVERAQYDGVEARWHDQDNAKRETVKVAAPTAAGGGPSRGRRGDREVKRLPKVYHSEASARSAADAESRRSKRAGAEMDYDLASGRPDLFPDRPIRVTGFKPEIDAKSWLIAEATHTLDAGGGLKTKLKLETQ